MGNVNTSPQITNVKDPEERVRFTQICLQGIIDQVNGGLQFVTNITASQKTVNFTAANTNLTIEHGLGTTPTGYIPISKTVSMNIFTGTVAKNATTITLKSSAIGTAVILFI